MIYLLVFFVFFGLSFVTLFLFFSKIDFVVDVIVTAVATIYRPSKKLNIFWMTKYTWKRRDHIRTMQYFIDDWLLLNNEALMFFSTYCKLCNHSPCAPLCDSSFALYPSLVAKIIHTLLHNKINKSLPNTITPYTIYECFAILLLTMVCTSYFLLLLFLASIIYYYLMLY